MAEAGIEVKKEVLESADIENRILVLCREISKGITDQVIQNDMPSVDAKDRIMAINKLLSAGQIELLKSGNQLIYRAKDLKSASKVSGGDNQEKLVYQIIESAGNKGIWIRDIRYKSNLLLTQLNKILKSLESKKLIKAIKSVSASKKKVYMLYDLEPDRSVTGGAWYSDQDFESEFVEVLNQQCYKFLEQKAANAQETKSDPIARRNAAFTPSADVWKYITELGISKVQLTMEDIETILDTLVYDGKVEKTMTSSASTSSGRATEHVWLYRTLTPLIPPTGLMRMPCGVCPVFNECCDDGAVSPSKCIYMKEWLDL